MSLVTTASDIVSRTVRQRAATRAVLPPPTGPPTPIRTGAARRCRQRGGSPPMRGAGHELRHAPAVPRELQHPGADHGDGLRVVELQPAVAALLLQPRGDVQQEL